MSISSAPARTASSTSATLTDMKLWPDGKAVATDATRTPLPRRCSTASATRAGYTQIAATEGIVGSPGFGRIPFAHRAVTLPGVSEPSSVVRSMQRTARSSAQSFDAFLIDRLASDAARSSAPTSSTLRTPRMSEPRCVRESAVATNGIMRRLAFCGRVLGDQLVRQQVHQEPVVPRAIQAAFVVAHDADRAEAHLRIAPNRGRVVRREVDHEAMVAAVSDELARQCSHSVRAKS